MDSENIISWNVTNWITIVLMAAVGFAILGYLQSKFFATNKATA